MRSKKTVRILSMILVIGAGVLLPLFSRARITNILFRGDLSFLQTCLHSELDEEAFSFLACASVVVQEAYIFKQVYLSSDIVETVDEPTNTLADRFVLTPTPIVAPTRTSTPAFTPTSTPTPLPTAISHKCSLPPIPRSLAYLPLVANQAQSIPVLPSEPPSGTDLLGVKDYWPYTSMVAGDHQIMVNLSNGNLLVGFVDQDIPAPGIENAIWRTYNSLSSYHGDFGRSWSSNVGNVLRLQPQTDGAVVLYRSSGAIEIFERQADQFAAPLGFHYTLQQNTDTSYILTSIADGIQYRFSNQGQLTAIVDRNGNRQNYQRDANGNVVEIIDSIGESTIISYNGSRAITSITDRAARVSQYTYDPAGRLASYTNPAQLVTTYRYDECGFLTEIVDVGSNSWSFAYDLDGRIVLITDPLGHVTQFTYQDSRTILTDANGYDTFFRYDDTGKLQERTDANGSRVRYGWDQFYNLISIITPLGHQSQLTWNGNTGLLATESDPLGNTVSYAYDTHNNLTSITDARGNITRFSYDAAGANLLSVIQPDSGETTFTYDAGGNPLTMIDPSGNAGEPSNPSGLAYKYVYDDRGDLAAMVDPLGNRWAYTWGNTGNLLSVQDAKGQLTQYAYDLLDRLTSVTYADGSTVSFVYDALNNLTKMTDEHGTTVYTYDAAGQLQTENSSRSVGTIQYSYDAVGNLTRLIRENGTELLFHYDPGDRLMSQSNPFDNGQLIRYRYDDDDRLVDIIYPNGEQTSYSYYANDWLESLLTTAADGTVYGQYEYPGQSAGGYDANGNPRKIHRSFANFDELGNLGWTVETWEMVYDEMDRMTRQDNVGDDGVWQWQVALTYNPNGLWATRSYRDDSQSQSWTYSYDAASRWTGILFWDGRRDVVINDNNGNQLEIREEFLESATGSGNLSFTAGLQNEASMAPLLGLAPTSIIDNVTAATTIITNTTIFEYDAADRVSKVTDPLGNWFTYGYDGFDRIVEIDSSAYLFPKVQYYDLLGMAREIQGPFGANYLYDLAGNVRANQLEGQPCQYLHRDARNQISYVSRSSESQVELSTESNWLALSDNLLSAVDYCFMGNVQSGSVANGATFYEPFLSTGLYATVLQSTWQASVLYHRGAGEFWPNNSQLSSKNIPAAASLSNLRPGSNNNGDDDEDPCKPGDSWWKCLLKRLLKVIGKIYKWIRTPSKYNPWIGKWFERHPSHHGQGPHYEAIIRWRNGKNIKIIYPSKKGGWKWPFIGIP